MLRLDTSRIFAMKKPWPVLKSDEEAEEFVATADLTEYDFGQMVQMTFEYTAKDSPVTMRLPGGLLDAVKAKTRARVIPYQRYIREVLEREVRQ
jgi:predicted DNA binding CopG/RHH family protein